MRLYQSGASKSLIAELNKSYDTISYPTVLRLFDKFASESDTAVNQWYSDVIHCGDNVDIRMEARHELEGKSSYDFHMYNNMLFKPRIDLSQYSDRPPVVPDPEAVDYGTFLPSETDQSLTKEKLVSCVMAVLGNDKLLPIHEFSAEMKLKTEKVSRATSTIQGLVIF